MPSRWHHILIWGVYTGVVCALLFLPIEILWRGLAIVVVIAHWFIRQPLMAAARQVKQLRFGPSGLVIDSGDSRYVTEHYAIVLRHPYLIILSWHQQNRRVYLPLLRDALTDEDWRRLTLWRGGLDGA